MQFKNQKSSYGWISIAFHWVIATSLLGMFALGLWMVELDYYSTWYHDAPSIHKSLGVLVVLAMLLRFLWNVFNPKPKPLEGSAILRTIASTVHLLFYLLVLLIGVSGYLISTAESQAISVFNWFDVPALFKPFENQADIAGEIHELLVFTLIGFAVLHALAALKHHFIDKDNTLKRMLKPSLNDLEN